MAFKEYLRSKMEKAFPPSSLDPDALNDPPPPYVLPAEFRQAGIQEDELEILRDYNTVMIVDDSGSMESLWDQACRALATLAIVASRYDTNGIDIHFLNHRKAGKHLKSPEDVEELFESVSPCGPTPLGECLERVTIQLLKDLDKGKSHRKTNYIVITDGRPTDDAESAIVQIARRLDKAGATLSQLGIQFIQIGSDSHARSFLESLDDDLKEKYSIRDIVDTEPYVEGEVTAARLTKLLLGGINRKIDRSS
ncbi:hypothetical protein BDM02DRAFT_3110160 [Thelephora ganbajun]|uniref:Uncharacterized protein n=1 Tax=Thelephora ganbajun TaxID=370292 RepID=A0ACB6ZPM6_THEGA|nr:hypothetical protein BDM02DRAFT_3110160 [Thelephora ganbajun]